MCCQCLVLVNEGGQTRRICRWITRQSHDPTSDLWKHGEVDPILVDPFD
jgi:hypothetical protein